MRSLPDSKAEPQSQSEKNVAALGDIVFVFSVVVVVLGDVRLGDAVAGMKKQRQIVGQFIGKLALDRERRRRL